jgi:predicted N-formylglutamate amidohydrolase
MASTNHAAAWVAGEVLNPEGRTPLVLICEHASNAMPPGYGTLGCEREDLERHIAVDVGAAALSRGLAKALDAPAILCSTSRLFVDCNRYPFDDEWMPSKADGSIIPANVDLTGEEKQRRFELVFEPFHAMVGDVVARKRRQGPPPLLIAIHTYAANMNGVPRLPAAVIWDEAEPARQVVAALRSLVPEVADNSPYDGRIHRGYTFGRHARPFGLRRFAIEVRQDLLNTEVAVGQWVGILAHAFSSVLPQSTNPSEGRSNV